MEPVEILILLGFLIVPMIPAGILLAGALYLKKSVPGTPGILIAIGATLLAISSLQTGLQYYFASTQNMETLAAFTLKSTAIFGALYYISLLLIGIGLIFLAVKIKTQQSVPLE